VANAGRIERLTQELQRQDAAYRAIENAVGSALDRFADVLAQGKTDWKNWGDAGRAALQDITREIIKMAVMNPLKNFLFGSNQPTLMDAGGIFGRLFGGLGLGNLFGGSSAAAAAPVLSGIYHSGGLVAAAGPTRSLPASVFLNAQRFHDGGFLRADEVPAILQRGERVLNRAETRAYEQGRASGGQPVMMTFNVTTPDASSFRRAQGQITAEMAAAVERARRNL